MNGCWDSWSQGIVGFMIQGFRTVLGKQRQGRIMVVGWRGQHLGVSVQGLYALPCSSNTEPSEPYIPNPEPSVSYIQTLNPLNPTSQTLNPLNPLNPTSQTLNSEP